MEGRERDRNRGPEAPKEGREDRRNQGKREREREREREGERERETDRQTSSVAVFAQDSEHIARVNKPGQRDRETIMSSKEAMAGEIRRLREKIRALEARDIEIEKEAHTADSVMIS